MHGSSVEILARLVSKYLTSGKSLVADVGCAGDAEYQRVVRERGHDYEGVDTYQATSVKHIVEQDTLQPIQDAAFDAVISGQTLEHVRKPWKWILGVARIAKPGGVIIVIAPNTWEFHEYPYDCWRVWPEGMRALFEEADLEVLEVGRADRDTWGVARKKP